jgi:hypothetical protein
MTLSATDRRSRWTTPIALPNRLAPLALLMLTMIVGCRSEAFDVSNPDRDGGSPATVAAPESAVNGVRDEIAIGSEFAAQIGRRRGGWDFVPQETVPDRMGIPEWEFDRRFRSDAFRFVRVKFDSLGRRGPNGLWFTDYPDSDLNFSFRLKQLTTMDVDPDPLWLDITDPRLFEYPFLYMIEPGFIRLDDDEVVALRAYFDRGGFMMVDDFWGEYEWQNFHAEMSRVFPDREPLDLPFEHPIFHLVYDLPFKPQVPSIHNWERTGLTYEREDATEVHYRAYFDDNGRMVMIICHNTDLGDGWEREGESREYFETFSERLAYPMGINIVVYAMTH